MLKIKDDYDLDGLKKYGFIHIFGSNNIFSDVKWDYWRCKNKKNYTEYTIYTENRKLDLGNTDDYSDTIDGLDTLYNMIIDGIVEKVVE